MSDITNIRDIRKEISKQNVWCVSRRAASVSTARRARADEFAPREHHRVFRAVQYSGAGCRCSPCGSRLAERTEHKQSQQSQIPTRRFLGLDDCE